MYISVPKNYSGNAFPHADAPRPSAQSATGGTSAPPPAPFLSSPPGTPPQRQAPPFRTPPSPVAPLGKIPRDCPLPPPLPPEADCAPDADGCEPCAPPGAPDGRRGDAPPCHACGDLPPCGAEQKNPLTCLFEALRGRKRAGLDADDFLLVGLIALLMGREGSEDIVLILGLLLLL